MLDYRVTISIPSGSSLKVLYLTKSFWSWEKSGRNIALSTTADTQAVCMYVYQYIRTYVRTYSMYVRMYKILG